VVDSDADGASLKRKKVKFGSIRHGHSERETASSL
jgi:hypothetical protein